MPFMPPRYSEPAAMPAAREITNEALPSSYVSTPPAGGRSFWDVALPGLVGAGVTGLGALVGGGEGAATAAAGFARGGEGEWQRGRAIELAKEQERTRNMRQIEEEQRREKSQQDIETRAENRWKEHFATTAASNLAEKQRNQVQAPPKMGLPPGTMIDQTDLVKFMIADRQAEAAAARSEKTAGATASRQEAHDTRMMQAQIDAMKEREREARGREVRAAQQQWNRGLMGARESALREGVTPDAAEAAYRRRFSEPGEQVAGELGFGEDSPAGVPTPPPQVGVTPSASPTPQASVPPPPQPCPPGTRAEYSPSRGTHRCV